MPSGGRRKQGTQTQEQEGEDMTTDTQEQEVNTEFPKQFGDMIFQTPDELAKYTAGLKDQLKEMNPIVKATKPGRPVSDKKVTSEAVASFLNASDDKSLKEALGKITDDFVLRLNLKDGVFSIPTVATRTSNGGGGNRGGRAIDVDGIVYTSAKSARDKLHPDMKDKSQNYEAIAKYLEGQSHTVVRS